MRFRYHLHHLLEQTLVQFPVYCSMMLKRVFAASLLLLLISFVLGRKEAKSKGKCEMCQSFARAFEQGLKDTENSNFAGGDTSWEEKNQPVYANSEVRLIEILESVCGGNDYECTRFLDKNEEQIERWWLKLRLDGHEDIGQWLCFEHLKICCPKGTYGSECTACPGGADNPCNNHGTCKGSGEVDGSGECICDDGYHGTQCESCRDGFYSDADGNCEACDESCKNTCTGPGPSKCDDCAKGYFREDGKDNGGCEDIDECDEELAECKDGTYCHNTPGSYQCKKCDKSCKDVCTGPGSARCRECGNGYKQQSEYCFDIDECTEGKSDCVDGTYCHNTQGSFECKECDESCLMTCTKSGPSGCDVCKEGYTMNNDACEDLDECSSYPPPCDERSEFCSNTVGSYACKCKSGYTRVEGKCVSWDEADDIRAKKSGKKSKKSKKKKGKKQPEIQEQDQLTTDNNNNIDDSTAPLESHETKTASHKTEL